MNTIYYGQETKHALENFPFSTHRVHIELIYAIVIVKKAAAWANYKAGNFSQSIGEAIEAACDEILAGKFDDQFVTPALQGGAGTSINMNVNEVIAARATQLIAAKEPTTIHYLDHVNRSQSTNDVNPSALKIACLSLVRLLLQSIDTLITSLNKRSVDFKDIVKLGRTHLQDAVPTTLGEEFASYVTTIQSDKKKIEDTIPYLHALNLGGTAIGNCINASKSYREYAYQRLGELCKYPIQPASNLMSQTSSQTDFVFLSAAITALMVDLSKIANDIRLMASGPIGGFGEIQLPALQKGSTIMPGKVNPVIPEAVNQAYFLISGHNLTIQHVAQSSQFELANMFPILADYLIIGLKLASEVSTVFAQKCVDGIIANKDRCRELLEKSTAYATLLTPVLGYDVVDKAVKESLQTKKTIREIIVEKKLLTNEEFDKAVHTT